MTTPLERRDAALLALAALTGARVRALTSFHHGHINLRERYVEQDARTVQTKFAKSFRTYFFPVGHEALTIFSDWHRELERDHLWGPADPLFPATEIGLSSEGGFSALGLARRGWAASGSVRDIFKHAFERAGLPYYNPHSFRDMLVHHAFTLDLSPEEMKAWSQNLGHADVLTTFTSYGQIPTHRQGELVRRSGDPQNATGITNADIAAMKAFIGRIELTNLGG